MGTLTITVDNEELMDLAIAALQLVLGDKRDSIPNGNQVAVVLDKICNNYLLYGNHNDGGLPQVVHSLSRYNGLLQGALRREDEERDY